MNEFVTINISQNHQFSFSLVLCFPILMLVLSLPFTFPSLFLLFSFSFLSFLFFFCSLFALFFFLSLHTRWFTKREENRKTTISCVCVKVRKLKENFKKTLLKNKMKINIEMFSFLFLSNTHPNKKPLPIAVFFEILHQRISGKSARTTTSEREIGKEKERNLQKWDNIMERSENGISP